MEIVGVAALTRYLRELLDSTWALQSVWIEGEVSNFRRSPVGHCYFTLKDRDAQLRCVWFSGSVPLGAKYPRDGDQVVAHGRVSIYEERGEYQLYVTIVHPAGAGVQNLRFEELRGRLEREGLFEPARKRPPPRFPRRIGVVTSPIGAAFHDVCNVIRRRFPDVELVLAPTQVQGENAPELIAFSLEALNEVTRPDVILLVRGGGSLEDISAFNHEVVARAIHGSRAPVVSGVGHDTDITIADLVADLRAPTPSAAAELVVPDARELIARNEALRRQLRDLTLARLSAARRHLDGRAERLRRHEPRAHIADRRIALDLMAERAQASLRHRFELRRARLDGLAARLEALNPMAVLSRGYAIVRSASSGAIVRGPANVYPGAPLDIHVADGRIAAYVAGRTAPRPRISAPDALQPSLMESEHAARHP